MSRVTELAATFASTNMGEGISGSRLSRAEEIRVSVLTRKEAKIADAITVTYYLDSNGKEREGEFHDRW